MTYLDDKDEDDYAAEADVKNFFYSEAAIRQRILDFVPWHWREFVCTCYNPKGRKVETPDAGITYKCLACNKYERWLFLRCHWCHEYFIRHFVHHATFKHGRVTPYPDGSPFWEVNHYTTCYNCLVERHGEVDGSYAPSLLPDGDRNYFTEVPAPPRSAADMDFNFEILDL